MKTMRFFSYTRGIGIFAILFLIALGLALATHFDVSARENIPVGVIDEDQSALSAKLTEEAGKDTLFAIRGFDAKDRTGALNILSTGTLEALFIIPKGYGQKLESGVYKDSVSLYFSPYSTLGKTLSDAFGALVFRQYIQSEVVLRARGYAGEAAEKDAEALLGTTPLQNILRIETIGSGGVASGGNKAHTGAYLLAMFAAFYILCAISLPQNMSELSERMVFYKNSATVFSIAYVLAHALPFLCAAFAYACFLAFASGLGQAALFFASFALYIFCLAMLLLLVEKFRPAPAARIGIGVAFCLLNAVFAYPGGLFAHALRFIFPASLFMQAQQTPVFIFALLAFASVFALPSLLKRRASN
jgi:hypothetical protein